MIKIIVAVIIIAIVAAVAIDVYRKRAKARKIVSSLGTSTYRTTPSKEVTTAVPDDYTVTPYTRTQPRYDYGYKPAAPKTSTPKPAKRKRDEDSVYVESSYDSGWYSEPTYQAPVVDYNGDSSDRSGYSSPSSDSSYGGSSYGSSSGSSDYSSGGSSSSSYDSGSSSSSSDSSSY